MGMLKREDMGLPPKDGHPDRELEFLAAVDSELVLLRSVVAKVFADCYLGISVAQITAGTSLQIADTRWVELTGDELGAVIDACTPEPEEPTSE